MPFTNENEFQTFSYSMEILMYPSMQTLNWPKEASRVVKQVQVLAFIHDNNSFKGQLVLESHKALGDFVILGLVACLLVRISQSCCLPVPSASG